MTQVEDPASAIRYPTGGLSPQDGPAAARRAIEAGTLSAGFQRLALAFLAADEAYQIPARAVGDAEEAFMAEPSPKGVLDMERAEEAEAEAGEALWEAQLAALAHPTTHLPDLTVKEAMIVESLNAEEFEPVAAMLQATLIALRRQPH